MSDSVQAALERVRPLVEKLHANEEKLLALMEQKEKLDARIVKVCAGQHDIRMEMLELAQPEGARRPPLVGARCDIEDAPAWHNLPVDDPQFALHGRVRNALQKAGYATMGDVVRKGVDNIAEVGEDGKKTLRAIIANDGKPSGFTRPSETAAALTGSDAGEILGRANEGFEVGGVAVRAKGENGKASGFAWPRSVRDANGETPYFDVPAANPNLVCVVGDREYIDEIIAEAGPPFSSIVRDEASGYCFVEFHGKARDLILKHASE